MKKRSVFSVLGVLALALALGFALTGCKEDDGGGGRSVTLSGTPKIGETLTVTFPADGAWSLYVYYFADKAKAEAWDGDYKTKTEAGGTDFDGTYYDLNTGSFTTTLDANRGVKAGHYIVASVDYSDVGDVKSNILGPVTE